jgi:hypothetical protein
MGENKRTVFIRRWAGGGLDTRLNGRSWLKGRGGWDKNGVRRAIALKCPGRITLYVDPSGYDYGRYVGVKV